MYRDQSEEFECGYCGLKDSHYSNGSNITLNILTENHPDRHKSRLQGPGQGPYNFRQTKFEDFLRTFQAQITVFFRNLGFL